MATRTRTLIGAAMGGALFAAPLQVPAKSVSMAADVSREMGKLIGMPLRSSWDVHSKPRSNS